MNVIGGNSFLSGQALHFFADTVYDDAPHAVRALKQVIVLTFQAGFSDEVAGAELAVARLHLLLADFTDVARSMSEEAARQVTPPRNGNHFQDRHVGTMGFNKCDVRLRSVGLDNDGLEFRKVSGVDDLSAPILARHSHPVRDASEMLLHLSWIVPKEEHAEGRPLF